MQPSLTGLLVVAALLLLGRALGAPLLVALFASLAFGSTAFVTLTALGGSTPMIYTLVVALLIAAMLVRRRGLQMLGLVLRSYPLGWCILLLAGYVVCSAYLAPRLFAGQVIVFAVTSADESAIGLGRAIQETSLQPVSGNITQAAYLCLSLLSFFAVAAAALSGSDVSIVEVGLNPTRSHVLDVLARAGASVERSVHPSSGDEPTGTIRVRHRALVEFEVTPDEVPHVIDELPVTPERLFRLIQSARHERS